MVVRRRKGAVITDLLMLVLPALRLELYDRCTF
jgi:hypothetical protein